MYKHKHTNNLLFIQVISKDHRFIYDEIARYQAGLGVYYEADIAFPDNSQIKYALGLCCLRQQEWKKAIEYFSFALYLKSDYLLAKVRRAITYELNEQTKLAKADFESVLRTKATSYEDYRAKGIACYCFYDSDKHHEALKYFDKALEFQPNDCQSLFEKGFILESLELYEEATETYSKILELNPENIYFFNMIGCIFCNMGRDKKASVVFEKAWKIEPENPDIWYGQGICLFNLKQPEAAIFCFDKCLSFEPKSNRVIDQIRTIKSEIQGSKNSIEKEEIDVIPVPFYKIINSINNKQEKKISLLLEKNYRDLGFSFYRDLRLRLIIRCDLVLKFDSIRQLAEASNMKK